MNLKTEHQAVPVKLDLKSVFRRIRSQNKRCQWNAGEAVRSSCKHPADESGSSWPPTLSGTWNTPRSHLATLLHPLNGHPNSTDCGSQSAASVLRLVKATCFFFHILFSVFIKSGVRVLESYFSSAYAEDDCFHSCCFHVFTLCSESQQDLSRIALL